jgi:hypothetical protein
MSGTAAAVIVMIYLCRSGLTVTPQQEGEENRVSFRRRAAVSRLRPGRRFQHASLLAAPCACTASAGDGTLESPRAPRTPAAELAPSAAFDILSGACRRSVDVMTTAVSGPHATKV